MPSTLFVSPSTAAELIANGFPPDNITIIENSVDTALYTADPAVVKEPDLLLYTGRIKRYKNLELLLLALKKLGDQGLRLRLTIAGNGDDQERLLKIVQDYALSDRVTFLGFVNEQTKIDLYRRSIALVNPSMKEGWGITSIEANACGTAVIANNVPGLRDSVKDRESGVLFKENDCEDLCLCIRKVATDNELRKKLERGALAWAQSFSWETSAQRMEQWLQKVVATHGSGRALKSS